MGLLAETATSAIMELRPRLFLQRLQVPGFPVTLDALSEKKKCSHAEFRTSATLCLPKSGRDSKELPRLRGAAVVEIGQKLGCTK